MKTKKKKIENISCNVLHVCMLAEVFKYLSRKYKRKRNQCKVNSSNEGAAREENKGTLINPRKPTIY